MTITRTTLFRTLIYLAAALVLLTGFSMDRIAQAQSGGTWESCYLSWTGVFMGPPECGGPPPGSECSPGCSGPFMNWCPTDYCWSVFVPTPPPACASQGQSCQSSPNSCGQVGSGTINSSCNCTATTPSDTTCPPPSCQNGSPGPYPACPLAPTITCKDLDISLEGTYPNCYFPSCSNGSPGPYPACPLTPDPTCSNGSPGPYPACPLAPNPTCADTNQLGTYPFCYNPPVDPDPTCADSGQLGTYPFCFDPPGGDPAPTATLTANPNPASGNTALTWTSTNATSCTAVGTSFSTGGATSGTDSTVTPGFTYQVQCTGPGGSTTAQVTVGVIGGACSGTGPLSITASPTRVQPGGGTTLSWSGTNIASASCSIRNMNTGADIDTATVTSCGIAGETTPVANIQAQTTFRMICGALTKDVIVNVIPRYEEF